MGITKIHIYVYVYKIAYTSYNEEFCQETDFEVKHMLLLLLASARPVDALAAATKGRCTRLHGS